MFAVILVLIAGSSASSRCWWRSTNNFQRCLHEHRACTTPKAATLHLTWTHINTIKSQQPCSLAGHFCRWLNGLIEPTPVYRGCHTYDPGLQDRGWHLLPLQTSVETPSWVFLWPIHPFYSNQAVIWVASILIMSLHLISWNINGFHCSGTRGHKKQEANLEARVAAPFSEADCCALVASTKVLLVHSHTY